MVIDCNQSIYIIFVIHKPTFGTNVLGRGENIEQTVSTGRIALRLGLLSSYTPTTPTAISCE